LRISCLNNSISNISSSSSLSSSCTSNNDNKDIKAIKSSDSDNNNSDNSNNNSGIGCGIGCLNHSISNISSNSNLSSPCTSNNDNKDIETIKICVTVHKRSLVIHSYDLLRFDKRILVKQKI
jgi:hypothetical protein